MHCISCGSEASPTIDQDPHHPLSGLALVGSRAALSFAFAFLQRAWRSGEDADLCTELLLESLEALQSLPEASLFHGVSSVWLDVVERTCKFLRTVIYGSVNISCIHFLLVEEGLSSSCQLIINH